jgi:hypothetical protein
VRTFVFDLPPDLVADLVADLLAPRTGIRGVAWRLPAPRFFSALAFLTFAPVERCVFFT